MTIRRTLGKKITGSTKVRRFFAKESEAKQFIALTLESKQVEGHEAFILTPSIRAEARQCQEMLDAAAGLAGHGVAATLLWAGPELDEPAMTLARACCAEHGPAACTQLPGVWLARWLGDSAEAALAWQRALWTALRPHWLQRPAHAPRIWRT